MGQEKLSLEQVISLARKADWVQQYSHFYSGIINDIEVEMAHRSWSSGWFRKIEWKAYELGASHERQDLGTFQANSRENPQLYIQMGALYEEISAKAARREEERKKRNFENGLKKAKEALLE